MIGAGQQFPKHQIVCWLDGRVPAPGRDFFCGHVWLPSVGDALPISWATLPVFDHVNLHLCITLEGLTDLWITNDYQNGLTGGVAKSTQAVAPKWTTGSAWQRQG